MSPKAPARDARALFVRIPSEDAARLDRAAFELKLSKQDIVAGLVGRYVDPGSPASLAALRGLGRGAGGGGSRRVTVELGGEELTVGHHDFRPSPPAEVLTLEEAAELLRVRADVVVELAEARELPGRCLAGAWRFSRHAIVAWLEAGDGRGEPTV
jgi:excisionase family DNA binding protein